MFLRFIHLALCLFIIVSIIQFSTKNVTFLSSFDMILDYKNINMSLNLMQKVQFSLIARKIFRYSPHILLFILKINHKINNKHLLITYSTYIYLVSREIKPNLHPILTKKVLFKSVIYSKMLVLFFIQWNRKSQLLWKVYSLIYLKWKWKSILSFSILFNARQNLYNSRKMRTWKCTVKLSK